MHLLDKATLLLFYVSAITLSDAIQAASNLKEELKSSKYFVDVLLESEPDEQLSNEQEVLHIATSV